MGCWKVWDGFGDWLGDWLGRERKVAGSRSRRRREDTIECAERTRWTDRAQRREWEADGGMEKAESRDWMDLERVHECVNIRIWIRCAREGGEGLYKAYAIQDWCEQCGDKQLKSVGLCRSKRLRTIPRFAHEWAMDQDIVLKRIRELLNDKSIFIPASTLQRTGLIGEIIQLSTSCSVTLNTH